MSLSMANLALLAKVQTAVGTPAVPTAGDNAILCRNANPTLIKGKFIDRALLRGAKGNYGSLFASGYRSIDFEVELAASGEAGTPPAYGPLLKGCDLSELVDPGESVTYTPNAGGDTIMPLTLIGILDGIQFQLSDAKGTVSITVNSEDIPFLKFNFIGKYHALTQTGFPPGLNFDAFTQPLTVGDGNTPVFKVHGIDVVMQQFGLDLANQLVWRDLVGFAGVRNPDRKPKMTSIFELTTVAARDWGETVRKGDVGPVLLQHGTAPGFICEISLPKTQFDSEPSISEVDRIAMLNASMAVIPNVGNDELSLIFK